MTGTCLLGSIVTLGIGFLMFWLSSNVPVFSTRPTGAVLPLN